MKRASGFVAVVLVLLGCGQTRAQTESFEYNLTTGTYKTLNGPGFVATEATSISGQNVTGFCYTSPLGSPLGFLYNGTTYQTFAAPGAIATTPLAISGNEIVGQIVTGPNMGEGFIYDNSKFTLLNVPGAQSTHATGVAGGEVIGYYSTATTSYAFSYNNNSYSYISPGGSVYSYAKAISASGDIVGTYVHALSGGQYESGFLYDGTGYTKLSVAGASDTVATGISGNVVVGDYGTGITEFAYSYDMNAKTYTLLAVPGATSTTATGIDGQNIIGTYVEGGLDYGYVYNIASGTYKTIDIGQLQVIPTGISGNEVVGTFVPLSVPEPSSIVLLGTAMAVTAAIARMRRRPAGRATS